MINLDNRLNAAFELCRRGVTSADVGTDHARLAARLALEKDCRVFASDVKDGPLEAARRTVSELGAENITILKSDGLDEIAFADDVIVCGMGGELIADIVTRCRFTNADTRFILQPMTKAEVMRKRLCAAGFEIIEERTAADNGKIYSVMLWKFTGNARALGDAEAYCGKNRDRKYLETIARKLLKNASGMERSRSRSDEAEKLRETAAEIMRIMRIVENENI